MTRLWPALALGTILIVSGCQSESEKDTSATPGPGVTSSEGTVSLTAPAEGDVASDDTSLTRTTQAEATGDAGTSDYLTLGKDAKTLPGGLQFEDLKVGTGAEAKAGNLVSVHYTGWTLDGTKFDSSVDRGTPFEFALGQGQVIKGWDQGVAGMKIGGKRKLRIPADLAYGSQGVGSIPPNSVLVFDVELLDVK